MAETIDDRAIINRALNAIGSAGIGAIDEDTPLARQVRAVYYDRVDTALTRYDFSFSAQTYLLQALAKTSDNQYDSANSTFINGWREAFALPGTRLGNPRRILTDPRNPKAPLRQFLIEQTTIYADVTPLWAVVTVRAHPAAWSPPFRLAMIKVLSGAFAIPVAHDKELAKTLTEEGEGPPEMNGTGGLMGQAIAKDMAGNVGHHAAQWNDPLNDARL